MPHYKIRTPNGRIVEIDAPNEDAAIEGAKLYVRRYPNPDTAPRPGSGPRVDEMSQRTQNRLRNRPEPPARRRPRVSTHEDVARSARAGVAEGIMSAGDFGGLPSASRGYLAEQRAKADALGVRVPDWLNSALDVAQDPVSGLGLSWDPQTVAGDYARAAGEFLPGAAMPGGPVRRVASVVIPALTSETAGQIAEANGLDQNSADAWRLGAGLLGGALAGFEPRRPTGQRPPEPRGGQSPRARGIRMATKGLTPQQLREAATRLSEHGFAPTLTDVVDESGRAVIRDANSRMTPGRTRAQLRADEVTTNAPSHAANRAAQLTPAQTAPLPEVRNAAVASRRAQGRADYAAAGNGRVRIEDVADQLQGQREEIAAAARTLRTNKNYDGAAELEALLVQMDSGQPLFGDISVGALDGVKREMFAGARTPARMTESPGLTERGQGIDNVLAVVSSEYSTARDNYATNKQREAGLARGNLLNMTGPEGVAAIRRMRDAERAGAKVAVRQALQDWFTGTTSADAPLRRIQLEDDVRTILTELYGADEAGRLVDYAKVARERLNNARYVAPNTGPQTFNRGADAQAIADMANTGLEIATGGKVAIFRRVISSLLDKGLTDSDAQLLAEAAADPARLEAIIADIEIRQPRVGQQLRAALPRAAAVGAVSQSGSRERRQRPEPPR